MLWFRDGISHPICKEDKVTKGLARDESELAEDSLSRRAAAVELQTGQD